MQKRPKHNIASRHTFTVAKKTWRIQQKWNSNWNWNWNWNQNIYKIVCQSLFSLAVQFDCWMYIARYPWFVEENVFINTTFCVCVCICIYVILHESIDLRAHRRFFTSHKLIVKSNLIESNVSQFLTWYSVDVCKSHVRAHTHVFIYSHITVRTLVRKRTAIIITIIIRFFFHFNGLFTDDHSHTAILCSLLVEYAEWQKQYTWMCVMCTY